MIKIRFLFIFYDNDFCTYVIKVGVKFSCDFSRRWCYAYNAGFSKPWRTGIASFEVLLVLKKEYKILSNLGNSKRCLDY